MKKLWLIPAIALTLVACGNNKEEIAEEEEASVEVVEQKDIESEEEVVEEEETEEKEESSNSVLESYQEADILEENIPVNRLTPQVETDNQNKRILLFKNGNGEKVYKSIFIKINERLKIIDITNNDDDGLIYEGSL